MPNIEDLVKKYETLKGDRGVWEQHWEEIAERLIPREMGFVGKRTAGEKRTQKVFDSSPMIALERFAAVMDSMLTPRQNTWHGLRSTNDELNKYFEVKAFFEQVNRILFEERYRPRANFTGQNSERWMSLGAFGTGFVFTDYDRGLRYRNVSLRDMFVMENHQGMIDMVFRRIMLNARQTAQMFGPDNMPDKIKKALENPQQQTHEFEFFHAVMPNEDYMPGKLGYVGKEFVSVYVFVEDRVQMGKLSGYDSFPFSISRYVMAPDEIYGRGPGMTALADIKMLNEMSKTDIKAVHKLVDPPLLMHDDGILGNGAMKVNLAPGGLNFGGVNRDGRQLIQPLVTNARVDIAETKMQQRRNAIDDAFLVTLFQILVETPRMTATEALIRAQEKGMLLTPTMGRQSSEALGPLIERELELLASNFKLPPMPEILLEAQGEYEITYDSPMSRMQRAEELVGVQRTIELLTPFAQLNPDVMDVFNLDKLAELTADVSGVPASVRRSPQEIQSIRQARQQAQEQERMAMMAQPVAGAMKDVAQAQKLSREM